MTTNYKNDKEYLFIIDNIMQNKEFQNMNNIKHHNTTRMNHSIKVSYYSYKIAKILGLDYNDVARGGLLHDFYIEEVSKCNKIKEKILLFTIGHPNNALENSLKLFELTKKEEDIIQTHMFPVDYKIPKYAESWIVSIVDKVLSFREFFNKFKYKLSYVSNLYLIFLLNIIK